MWTVPGPGEPGNETWKGDCWKYGGGVAWHIGSYDAKLNLLYYGTSNPSPWSTRVRGNDTSNFGKYTNLYTLEHARLRPRYRQDRLALPDTPHDAWDYDGVNELVLADLDVGGQKPPVLMKADRNGFFYVLIARPASSSRPSPSCDDNWATEIDLSTGRPVEVPEKRPRLKFRAKDICPNLIGGKNWQPMSYNPQTGLVYIPPSISAWTWKARTEVHARAVLPGGGVRLGKTGPGGHLGELLAWDPVKQQKVWQNTDPLPYVGGMLSTAGGLVFHGDLRGGFKALDAKSGTVLWQFNTGSGVSAAPMTYELDGKQYVAVVSGRTFAVPAFFGPIGEKMVAASAEGGTLFVFELPSR